MAGTYIAVRVHPESEELIRKFCYLKGIPIVYPSAERRRHVTLIMAENDDFSKDFKPESWRQYYAAPNGWGIFKTQDGKNGLVLNLLCPQLNERHDSIINQFGCKDKYPEFKLHCTFSYDVGDRSIESLPVFTAPIILGDEYCEEYKANWGKA